MTASTEVVEFHGETFHVAERVGLMPMMRFAVLAKQGVDANEMEGLAAMYDLLKQCLHDDEWDRFERHVTDLRLEGDDMLELMPKVFAVLGDRPTGPRSSSSDGPRIIEPNSTADSSSPATGPGRVIDRLNDQGRPDLALLVRKRQESLASSA